MPALPEQFVDKIIAWTPVGNTFRGKLATRYLFPCIFAHTALLTLMLWGGIFLGLNIYLGRPLTDGMYLAILETLVCTRCLRCFGVAGSGSVGRRNLS